MSSESFIPSRSGPYDHVRRTIKGHDYYRYDYKGWAVMDKKTAEEGIRFFSQKFMYDFSLNQVAEIVMLNEYPEIKGYTLWQRPIRKQKPKDPKMLAAYYRHNLITPPKKKAVKKPKRSRNGRPDSNLCPECRSKDIEPSWGTAGYMQCNHCGNEWRQ